MIHKSRWAGVVLLVLALAVAACGSTAERSGAATRTDETAAPTTGETGSRVDRGTASSPAAAPTSEEPRTEVGVRRAVKLSEALRLVAFPALEPKAIARDYHLDAVSVFEQRPGEQASGLPKMVLVYQADSGAVLHVTEGPASGAPAPGSPVRIGPHAGGIVEEPGPVLTWEQDGVRIELRGQDLGRAQLLAAAESMAPFAPAAGR